LHGAFAPTPYAPSLEKEVTPNVARIVQAVRDLLEE
jgi:pyruvate/2-oxoglutarate/acetoin dehydrogenase E1 component